MIPAQLAEKAAGKASRALTGDVYVSKWQTTKGKGKKKKVVDRELHINPLLVIAAVGAGVLAVGVGMFATQATLKAKYGHKFAVINKLQGRPGVPAWDGIDFEKAKTMTYQKFHPSVPGTGHYITVTFPATGKTNMYTLTDIWWDPTHTYYLFNKTLTATEWIAAGRPGFIDNGNGYTYQSGMDGEPTTGQRWVEDTPMIQAYYTTEPALVMTGMIEPYRWDAPFQFPTKHYDAIVEIPEKWECKRIDKRVVTGASELKTFLPGGDKPSTTGYTFTALSWEAAYAMAYPDKPLGSHYKGHLINANGEFSTGMVDYEVKLHVEGSTPTRKLVQIGEKRLLPMMGTRTPTSLLG